MITENHIKSMTNKRQLLKLLKFPYAQNIRKTALNRLEMIGWKPKGIEDTASYLIAKGKINECSTLGNDAVWPLLRILKDVDPDIRTIAAQEICKIKDDRCNEYLKEYLFDNNARVREFVSKALIQNKFTTDNNIEKMVIAYATGDIEKATELIFNEGIGDIKDFITQLEAKPNPEPEQLLNENKSDSRLAVKGMVWGGIFFFGSFIISISSMFINNVYEGHMVILYGPMILGAIAFFSSLGYWLKNQD